MLDASFEGYGVNDVFAYNPSTGGGLILRGSGDGSAIDPNVGDVGVDDSDFTDAAGNRATSLALGGTLFSSAANGAPISSNGAEPDLLEIIGGVLYDNPGSGAAGAYAGSQALTDYYGLSTVNPYCQIAANGCSTDWTGWSVTSTSGRRPARAIRPRHQRLELRPVGRTAVVHLPERDVRAGREHRPR